MGTYAKRILGMTTMTVALALSAAGTAAADPSTAPGPGACFGPPGQSGLVQAAQEAGIPPGQLVSFCNLHGHGQNQDGGVV